MCPVALAVGRFDDPITQVADDQQGDILLACLQTGEAYAPYDGGADLFVASTGRRDRLKARFADWLSSHPEGL